MAISIFLILGSVAAQDHKVKENFVLDGVTVDKDTLREDYFVKMATESLTGNEDLAYSYLEAGIEKGIKDKQIEYINTCLELLYKKSDEVNPFHLSIFLQQMHDLLKSGDIDLCKTKIFGLLAENFKTTGRYSNSLQYYFKELKCKEDKQDSTGIASVYYNIAEIYRLNREMEKADEYFNKSINLYQILGNRDGIANNHNSKAGMYYVQHDFSNALVWALTAKKTYEELNNIEKTFMLSINIGLIYINMQSYDLALAYLSSAEKLKNKISNTENIVLLYQAFGEYYFSQLNYKASYESFLKAYNLTLQYNILIRKVETALALSICLEYLNDTAQAYSYYKIYHQVSDSLQKEKYDRQLSFAEMKYDFEKKMHTKELEVVKMHEAQKRTRLNYLFMVIGITLAFIIILLLFILQKSKLNKIELKKENIRLERDTLISEIEYKNKELTTNVMYLLKKNETIIKIIKQLNKAKLKFKPENHTLIDQTIKDLDSLTRDDIWHEFEIRFKEVHSVFYNKLNQRFPDLTPNEKKLCAFLRLNMTNKEISSITNQSVNSIAIGRFRLRKKIGLIRDDNLISFLENI